MKFPRGQGYPSPGFGCDCCGGVFSDRTICVCSDIELPPKTILPDATPFASPPPKLVWLKQ